MIQVSCLSMQEARHRKDQRAFGGSTYTLSLYHEEEKRKRPGTNSEYLTDMSLYIRVLSILILNLNGTYISGQITKVRNCKEFTCHTHTQTLL